MQELQQLADNNKVELGMATVKAAPPVTVAGLQLAGHPLSDWLILATLVYTVLQIAALLNQFYRNCRAGACEVKSDDSNRKQ